MKNCLRRPSGRRATVFAAMIAMWSEQGQVDGIQDTLPLLFFQVQHLPPQGL